MMYEFGGREGVPRLLKLFQKWVEMWATCTDQ